MKLIIAIFLLCFATFPVSAEDKCDALKPTNAQDVDEAFKGKMEGEIKGVLSRLAGGAASIDGEYTKLTTDELKNYPESNKLYVWQRIIYLVCINPDTKIDVNELLKLYMNPPRKASERTPDDVIDRLSLLLDEGSTIKKTFVDNGDTELLKKQKSDWDREAYDYLKSSLGTSYAIQFKNAHGNPMMGMYNGRSIEGGGITQEITGKTDFFNGLIAELRR